MLTITQPNVSDKPDPIKVGNFHPRGRQHSDPVDVTPTAGSQSFTFKGLFADSRSTKVQWTWRAPETKADGLDGDCTFWVQIPKEVKEGMIACFSVRCKTRETAWLGFKPPMLQLPKKGEGECVRMLLRFVPTVCN